MALSLLQLTGKPMVDAQEIERIQFKMQRIRRHMNDDVDRIQEDAARLMDWKYYLERHPIVSIAAVAAAGYFLVPAGRPVEEKKVYLDPDVSRELASQTEKLHVGIEETPPVMKKGVIVSLGALVLNTVVKAGMAYAGQQLRATLVQDFSTPRKRHEEKAS